MGGVLDWIGGAAGGMTGVPFVGPLIGGALDFFGGERANEANSAQAEANRQFQERMSSTAYQRATADMAAAGLNPMLAYQQGGASSPGGSMPAPMQNTLGSAVHTAMAYKRQAAEVENIKAQTDKTVAETPGATATSARLKKELEELVPVQIRTAQFEQDIRDAAAYFAQFEKNIPMGSKAASKMVYDFFASKFQMVPQELRLKMAETALKIVEERYHPYKLVAPAIGAAAGAASAFGLGKFFRGYAGMKGVLKPLGSGTGSPAVFRHKRPIRGKSKAESGYQYTRPLPGPSKY